VPGTMAERVAAQRRREFVGRAEEVAALRALLEGTREGAVLYVVGPGGVGKTTLLGRYDDLGRDLGRLVVRLDARELPPIASAYLAEIATQCGVDPTDDLSQAIGDVGGLLLLVDTTERLTSLDRWLREDLLPSLAADAVAVLAGREPPAVAWRTDPGWSGLVHTIHLANLSTQESRALLERRGVPPEHHAGALAFTRGHPLALALVADVAAQGGETAPLGDLHGVVDTLLATLVDTVPSPRHRRALEACAQVLTTTEPLLAALLDLPDAHELFAWLRGLSFVESGPRGLYPHDIARETLGAELRWRHPEQWAEIHRRAGAAYRRQFYAVPPAHQQQVLVEYVFLHRDNPVLGPFVTDSAESGMDLRALVATPAAPEERHLVVDMVTRQEGAESARLAEHWMERQPGSILLVRGPDAEVLGLVGTLALDRIDREDRDRDPAVDGVCALLEQRGGLAEGETAGFFRFWMQREGYQALGPIQLFITLHFVRYYLSTRALAFSFVYYADPDLWADICAYGDMARLSDADFSVGGRTYGVYGHDWRRTPPLAWLELLGDRELGDGIGAPHEPEMPTRPLRRLSDEDFATAVKAALGALGRATGLRGSPLLDAPLVASRVPADADDRARGEELRARIAAAAARLEASPRDLRGFRAVHHTYLQPAPTQAAAAELLDLPTTTYRRHLAWGIARITELLRHEDLDAGRVG
jgi:AAA ATPase domain